MSRITYKKAAIVLLLLSIALGSLAIYYEEAWVKETAQASTLQQLNGGLQARNSQLRQQLTVMDQYSRNASVSGFNPVLIYNETYRSVVTVEASKVVTTLTFFGPQQSTETDMGSGFILDNNGSYYVLTNFHVVDGAVNVTATLWNGDAYPATVLGSDPLSDLAVISANAPVNELYPLSISASYSLRVGMPVVAIGNPFGLSGSVTFGIISQLGRAVQYQSTYRTFEIADIIQFSAPINPGNSGGPLLDANGFVVGITSAAVTSGQGVGFAIPSDTILRELPFLIKAGRYDKHPYLEIQVTDMSYMLSQAMHVNVTYGVLIEQVQPGGPADKAGLRGGNQNVTLGDQEYTIGGDIIVAVDGNRVINYDSFSTYMERHVVPGQTITLEILRSGIMQSIRVLVGTKPSPE